MNSPSELSSVNPFTPFPVPVVSTKLALAAYIPVVRNVVCGQYSILQQPFPFPDEERLRQKGYPLTSLEVYIFQKLCPQKHQRLDSRILKLEIE